MASFHNVVSLRGIHFNDFFVTMNMPTTVVKADEGKAVSLDTTANKAKLAADDAVIIGRLEVVEVRSSTQVLGTIALKFINTLPIKTGETVAVGDTVIGAGSGEVKAAMAANHNANFVVEVDGSLAVVVKN